MVRPMMGNFLGFTCPTTMMDVSQVILIMAQLYLIGPCIIKTPFRHILHLPFKQNEAFNLSPFLLKELQGNSLHSFE